MKIKREINVVDGRYEVQVSVVNFSSVEQEKMIEFGEPEIEIGGNFTGTAVRSSDPEEIDVDFDLPQSQRRLRTEFPIKQVFDTQDEENADVMAKVFADTIAARITSAKTTLVGQTAEFEGETTTTI